MTKVAAPPSLETLLAAKLADTPFVLGGAMAGVADQVSYEILHHIYQSVHAPDSFNPCSGGGGGSGGGSGRFHPFLAENGKPVPVFYAATSEEGGYCETLFRSVDGGDESAGASCRRVPGKRVCAYSHATLRLTTRLALAHLSGNQLHRLGITRNSLLESGALHYAHTAAWAAAIHAAYPTLHGLAWVSRQHDASTCIMLFGDRVFSTDLTVLETLDLQSAAGRARADEVAKRLMIVITR